LFCRRAYHTFAISPSGARCLHSSSLFLGEKQPDNDNAEDLATGKSQGCGTALLWSTRATCLLLRTNWLEDLQNKSAYLNGNRDAAYLLGYSKQANEWNIAWDTGDSASGVASSKADAGHVSQNNTSSSKLQPVATENLLVCLKTMIHPAH
jgi:hypothetical protein